MCVWKKKLPEHIHTLYNLKVVSSVTSFYLFEVKKKNCIQNSMHLFSFTYEW